jgi:hypothetical protein
MATIPCSAVQIMPSAGLWGKLGGPGYPGPEKSNAIMT